MWHKKAKVILDIMITAGIIISILTGGVIACIQVMFAYAIPDESASTTLILFAIATFIIIALGGTGLTIMGVSAYGLLTEIAENTDKIREIMEQKPTQEPTPTPIQDEYQKYRYR